MRLQTHEIEIDVTMPRSSLPQPGSAQDRIDELLDALPDTFSTSRRIHLLQEAARLYVSELGEPEAALVVLQAALLEDFNYEPVIGAIADLADRTGAWSSLLSDLIADAEERAADDPVQASLRWLRAAAWYHQPLGEMECAQQALDRALALSPESVPALELQAVLHQERAAWTGVLASWDLLLKQTIAPGRRLEILLAAGETTRERLGDDERAIEYYREAHEQDASCRVALDELESLYRETDATASLCRILWKKARLVPNTDDSLCLELEVAHLLGDVLENHEQAGRIFDRIADRNRAVTLLTRKAAKAPATEKALLHYRIARLLTHGEPGDARIEWHLQEALSHDAEHVAAGTLLLESYTQAEEWGKAAKLYETRAQRSRSKRSQVQGLMQAARLYYDRLNNPSRATALLEQAREVAPNLGPAAKLLAQIHFEQEQWSALAPVVEELLADQSSAKPGESARLHLMAGACAHAREDSDLALEHYQQANRACPGDGQILRALGQLSVETQSHPRVLEVYEALLQNKQASSPAEEAEFYFRLGEAKRQLGDSVAALASFKQALRRAPRHRAALAGQTRLHEQRGDWKVVANAKRDRLQTATDEVKAMLLVDLGDIECDELSSPESALAAYQDALALQPQNHRLMQRILDLAARLQKWSVAYEMIIHFIELETDAKHQGNYHLAAAEISRDKLGARSQATWHYEQSLDAFFQSPPAADDPGLPRYMKAFADLDAILTRDRSWKKQELAYRRMIKRLGPEHPLLASLWKSLGEIYRSRLEQTESAVAALEVARTLTPEDVHCREQLAELYTAGGSDRADKAIAEHQAILTLDPGRRSSYQALAELYERTGRRDACWNLCQALVVLERATPAQRQFIDAHRQTFMRLPRGRVPAALWPKLIHPGQEPTLSSLLLLLAPHLLASEERSPRSLGLKSKELVVLSSAASDQQLHALSYFADVLSLARPKIYVKPKKRNRLDSELLCTRGVPSPTLVVGEGFLSLACPHERAFVAGQKLSRLRQENWISLAHPDAQRTQEILDWALGRRGPEGARTELSSRLDTLELNSPLVIEQLQQIVRRMRGLDVSLDAGGWLAGQSATADRVGLLLCGDLGAAARSIASEGSPHTVQRMSELLRFSTSEAFFEIRGSIL